VTVSRSASEISMLDLVLIATGFVLFAVAIAYQYACDKF
jgi:hypothetical protein